MKKIVKFLSLSLLFVSTSLWATPFDIVQTYYQIQHTPRKDGKIEQVSRFFLERPYKLGPLGEGKHGKFDRRPLYDFSAFDCLTLVETTLALAYAKEPSEFLSRLNSLRYRDGDVDYLKRNHFTSLDWNLNNSRYVKDITTTLRDARGKPVSKHATALIDKGAWFKSKTLNDLVLPKSSLFTKRERLSVLRSRASEITPQNVTISYVPLTALFNRSGEPVGAVFGQIPSGSIVEIIRPNWNLRKKIGTNLHISHLGFAFRNENGELIFRQASSELNKVADVNLAKYLKKYLSSPTVKGIKVLVPKNI